MNKDWHVENKMPKDPTPEQRLDWHKNHAKNCDCRPIPKNLLPAINDKKSINPFFLDSQFLKYCVKQGWLKQVGPGGRGTRWLATTKGRAALKEKFNIEI